MFTRWKFEVDNKQRWENNLMGWYSMADPVSMLELYNVFTRARQIERNITQDKFISSGVSCVLLRAWVDYRSDLFANAQCH